MLTDPQLEAFDTASIVLCDVLGVALGQQGDLLLDLADVLLRVLEVDLLDGDDFLGDIVDAKGRKWDDQRVDIVPMVHRCEYIDVIRGVRQL